MTALLRVRASERASTHLANSVAKTKQEGENKLILVCVAIIILIHQHHLDERSSVVE